MAANRTNDSPRLAPLGHGKVSLAADTAEAEPSTHIRESQHQKGVDDTI